MGRFKIAVLCITIFSSTIYSNDRQQKEFSQFLESFEKMSFPLQVGLRAFQNNVKFPGKRMSTTVLQRQILRKVKKLDSKIPNAPFWRTSHFLFKILGSERLNPNHVRYSYLWKTRSRKGGIILVLHGKGPGNFGTTSQEFLLFIFNNKGHLIDWMQLASLTQMGNYTLWSGLIDRSLRIKQIWYSQALTDKVERFWLYNPHRFFRIDSNNRILDYTAEKYPLDGVYYNKLLKQKLIVQQNFRRFQLRHDLITGDNSACHDAVLLKKKDGIKIWYNFNSDIFNKNIKGYYVKKNKIFVLVFPDGSRHTYVRK